MVIIMKVLMTDYIVRITTEKMLDTNSNSNYPWDKFWSDLIVLYSQ